MVVVWVVGCCSVGYIGPELKVWVHLGIKTGTKTGGRLIGSWRESNRWLVVGS